MTGDVRLSIALVTRNRPHYLRRCLQSLHCQTVRAAEVVVSDDSTTPDVMNTVAAVAAEFGCLYVAGPRRGLYANRNHSIAHCSGSHVLTCDDDHTHPVDYVQKIVALIAQDPSRIWAIGERYPGDAGAELHLPGEYGRRGNARPVKNPDVCAAIADGSTVYPRLVFQQTKYEDRYRFGDLYLLLGRELEKRGWRMSVSQETFVIHHIESNRDRETNLAWMTEHHEANHFVRFACALGIFRGLYPLCRAVLLLLRDLIMKRSIQAYSVTVRLSPTRAIRAVARAADYARRLRQDIGARS